MSLIRKVFWPLAAALGLLAFLVAASPSQANYQYGRHTDGDFCAINGPKVTTVGQTVLFAGVLDHWSSHGTTVSLDNIIGSSKITSVVDANDNYTTVLPTNLINSAPNFNVLQLGDYGHRYGGYDNNYNNEVLSMHSGHQNISLDNDVIDELAAIYGQVAADATLTLNSCGAGSVDALTRLLTDAIFNGNACNPAASSLTIGCSPVGINGNNDGACILTTAGPAGSCINTSGTFLFGDWDIDCPTSNTCTVATAMITGVANAILADLTNPYKYGADYRIDCYDIATDAAKAAILSGAPESVAVQVYDFVYQACGAGFELGDRYGFHHDGFIDSLVIVDVTCIQAGNYDISFSDERETDDAISQHVICRGPASSKSTIVCSPTPCSVEIVPAVGNVSHSLITVTLLDSDGNQAGIGGDVDFTVDRCSIESSGVLTKANYDGAKTVFGAYNVNSSSSAAAIEASPPATAAVDSNRTADSVKSFDDTNTDGSSAATLAAAILGCNPDDAQPTATPGVATVTAIIAVSGQDVVLSTKVTVVGPPFAMTISASPTTVRCGEKATITVSVKDAVGQNVSEHTRIEAVTNAGGVLGGTGAVANLSGPVVPISSTVGETFQGQATFYLLTSEQHSGPYEVVVTTGGSGSLGSALGGVFSTPPVVIQTTVTCTIPAAVVAPSAPAPAPTITAPRTGQGPSISPPNTGDAGLAAASTGTNWTLFALVGLVSFAIAGLATVKFARR